jgi:hypothetical protein
MRNTIISLLVMLPMAAFAAEGGSSEYFYQTGAGKHEVTPRLSIESTSVEIEGTESEVTGNVLGVAYQFGATEDIAVGAALNYTFSGESDDGTDTVDRDGLEDLELFVKAGLPMGGGTLRYGANLNFALEDAEVDSEGNENTSSGGTALTPYVGYEQAWGNCVAGAKLSVEVGLTDRTTDNNGTTTDESGAEATTIGLFYEHKLSDSMRLGASLDWVTVSDTTDETNGGDSENVSPLQLVTVYLPTKVGNGLLLPSVEYGMTTDDKIENLDIDGLNVLNLRVGYRIEL